MPTLLDLLQTHHDASAPSEVWPQELPAAQSIPLILALAALSLLGARRVSRRAGRLPPLALSPRLDGQLLAIGFVALLLFTLLANLVVSALQPSDVPLPVVAMFLSTVATFTGCAVVILGVHKLRGGAIHEFGLHAPDPGSLRWVLPTYLSVLPAYFAATLLEHTVRSAFDWPLPEQRAVQGLAEDPALLGNPLVILCVVVAIPFLEELLFRGTLLPVLQRYTRRPLIALLLNATIFALAHDAGRCSVFVLGFGMAWLFARTGSLWPAVLFHSLHNGATLLLLAVTASMEQSE